MKSEPTIPDEFWRRGRCLSINDDLTFDVLVDLGFGIFQVVRARLRGVDNPKDEVVRDILSPNKEVMVLIYEPYDHRNVSVDLVFKEMGGIPVNLAQFLALNGWGTPNEEYIYHDESHK